MSYANMFGNNSQQPQTQTVEVSNVPIPLNWPNVVGRPEASLALTKPQVQTKLVAARQTKDEFGVSEFGTEAGKKVAALADTVLQKTTTGKMGDFGDGITSILTLTSQLDVDDLNLDKKKGFIGRIVGGFKKKRVEVLAQFENTSKSIQKVVDDLGVRQRSMKDDNQFLEKLYVSNMEEYHDLGFSIEAASLMHTEMQGQYEIKKAEVAGSSDQFAIQAVNEFEQRIKRWEKQIDRLKRMQHVALLTAPEIRMIQAGNVTMVEKFDDLVNTTIPAWKKQLSMTIIAMRQKENAELGNAMDDKTNQFFRKAAELNHSNAILVAQASERSVVDIETLEHMQTLMIDSVKQVKAIQETGRQERAAASTKLTQMRDQMKTEMLSWQ